MDFGALGTALVMGIAAIGSIGKNYQKPLLMTILFGVQAWFDKWAFGIRKVVKAELYNEAMDYCEWKNGYRMEATTGVAKGLILKLQSAMLGSVTSLIMKRIGYVQGLEIGAQSDKTKFWEFALCTIIPTVTGILRIVPKFLWPISRQKREWMYAELSEKRQQSIQNYDQGDS